MRVTPVSDPMESLFTAAKMLLENKIHRLPVVDPRSGNTLNILTHKRILNHIYPYLIESELDAFFSGSIRDLGVGTYNDVKQVGCGRNVFAPASMYCSHNSVIISISVNCFV